MDMSGINNFSPDDVGIANGNYFGLPFSPEQSQLALISAPWDVTVSYNEGTAKGPAAILDASTQVELRDAHYPDGWRKGIATLPVDPWIEKTSQKTRKTASKIISHLEGGGDPDDPAIAELTGKVNQAGRELNDIIRAQAIAVLNSGPGKIAGLVGGDHSTPLGLMQAIAQQRGDFGILHIDAHADLREAYEGFTFSHASIMHNALLMPQVMRLVQVGIRDYSSAEAQRASHPDGKGRVVQFDDYTLSRNAFEGLDWGTQCAAIIECLPEKVYVSFDIDGLSPDNCPGTGTPVPGGLSYQQAVYLIAKVVESGRRIVGFDLTEVSPTAGDNEWNANIGARILYKLCNLTLLSQQEPSL